MSKLISQIYKEWQSVKKQAQQDCENRALFNMAEQYRACCVFKGTEDIEQTVRLFTSPQGVEFCQKYNFPNIETLRKFKQYDIERLGVFIDAGRITISNARKVMIAGNTEATIICDNRWRYEIVLMHGAKAIITASGWAVVSISNKNECEVHVNTTDRASIL